MWNMEFTLSRNGVNYGHVAHSPEVHSLHQAGIGFNRHVLGGLRVQRVRGGRDWDQWSQQLCHSEEQQSHLELLSLLLLTPLIYLLLPNASYISPAPRRRGGWNKEGGRLSYLWLDLIGRNTITTVVGRPIEPPLPPKHPPRQDKQTNPGRQTFRNVWDRERLQLKISNRCTTSWR